MEINENLHLVRQRDIIPTSVMGARITVIGAGAIGSWVTLSLVKMGFSNIVVFDFDTVDVENMSSQFYRFKDIGKNKAVALRDLVLEFTETEIVAVDDKWVGGKFPGIVISAVDSMEVRSNIWKAHKGHPFTSMIIDPRMGAEVALMYAMNPNDEQDIKSYEKTLYSDDDSVQERCTAKSTIYCANLLSGMVTHCVKEFLVNGEYPRVVNWDIAKDHLQAWRKTKVKSGEVLV